MTSLTGITAVLPQPAVVTAESRAVASAPVPAAATAIQLHHPALVQCITYHHPEAEMNFMRISVALYVCASRSIYMFVVGVAALVWGPASDK